MDSDTQDGSTYDERAFNQREYSNTCSNVFGTAARFLVSLPLHTLNILVSLWKETTEERLDRHENGPCYERYVLLTIGTPILVCLFLVSFIPSAIALPFYLCLISSRRKVTVWTDKSKKWVNNPNISKLSLLTMNTCLLPTFLAKFNNLSKTKSRSDAIARILCESGFQGGHGSNAAPNEPVTIEDSLPCDPDFICLQEVFNRSATSKLSQALKQRYWSVIERADGCNVTKVLPSGLFFASQHPILAANFESFSQSCGADKMADKGVLVVKVDLECSNPNGEEERQRAVGLICVTHLQAQEGARNDELRQTQMREVYGAINSFKSDHIGPGDRVMMETICGDLNMDWGELAHSQLHVEYVDVSLEMCQRAGCSAVGTEIIQAKIHADVCKTPLHLKRSLSMGKTRDLTDVLEGTGSGTQLDHILVSRDLLEKQVLTVETFTYLTAFAGLTDHIPLMALFRINPAMLTA